MGLHLVSRLAQETLSLAIHEDINGHGLGPMRRDAEGSLWGFGEADSHSHTRSESYLTPTPQLAAMLSKARDQTHIFLETRDQTRILRDNARSLTH